MTYKILETNPVINIHKFFVDTIEDLESLPKEPASTALVAATGDTYICTNAGTYVMYIDNPINSSGDEDNNNNVKYKLTGSFTETSTIDETFSIHFEECIVKDNLLMLDNRHEKITTASAGALIAIVIEGMMPEKFSSNPFSIVESSTDNLVRPGIDSDKSYSVDVYLCPLEDTREYDTETDDRRGYYAEFFIMPPDDIHVIIDVGESQE